MKRISSDNQNVKKIFIGGTGRSGTTITAELLGLHPDIYTLPLEDMRFITDPDGLISLKSAMIDHYNFFQSDFALQRFFKLMRKMKRRSPGAYPTTNFSSFLGADFFDEWLESLKSQLVHFEFRSNWVARTNGIRKVISKKILTDNKWRKPFFPNCYYGKRMDEQTFDKITKEWINSFYQQVAKQQNKNIVIDHNPLNIIHADFLHNIMPDLKLIHIYRDPRDVISSFTTQEWGGTPEQNLIWVSDIYKRWQETKLKLPADSFYEVSFEKIVKNKEAELKKICEFIGVELDSKLVNFDLSKNHMGRYHKNLNKKQIKQIEESDINPVYFWKD